MSRDRDHPRVGGEKSWWGDEVTPKQGSPPRGRGKAGGHRLPGNVDWITPAWAGKRCAGTRSQGACRDHPCVGGEKLIAFVPASYRKGSPLHGRGKGVDRKIALLRYGITPAWAGKRGQPVKRASKAEDHPRVGGEKAFWWPGYSRRLGSPPRGRGKEGAQLAGLLLPGITPAWAGKSRKCPASQPFG